MRNLCGAAFLGALVFGGCGLLDDRDVTFSGQVAQSSSVARIAPGPGDRRITHVMAVNPETASPDRSLAQVGEDGSFTLSVSSGKPYVLVFIDNTAVGAEMVVAVFRAGSLDTLSPQLAAHVELGMVEVDAMAQTATVGLPYDELISGLGLSAAAAEYLGSVDDLSLRYANPDIDGDGIIDMEQDRQYALDVHLRANLRIGERTANVTVNDLVDRFLPEDGPEAPRPVFNLTSIYALYPASFDATDYVGMGPPGTGLQAGASFAISLADGTTPSPMTSFSGLRFGDTRAWGPDYDFERTPGMELPGSTSPATLAYTLGALGTTLTFSNVVMPQHASLTDNGTLAIFLRLGVTDGQITQIDYRWMKRTSSSSWAAATADEIALTISSEGGYVSVHRAPSWRDEYGATIPPTPSGTIGWPGPASSPDEVCGLAVSFDDRLGVRHFIGGADPNPGVTCTP